MISPMLVLRMVCLGFALGASADATHEHAPASTSNAGFEKLKTLVGTWVAADESGKPTDTVVSVIKLTAGGSVIHETIFPGQPHEMVSIYTAQGSDVVMTHYCVLGNQPQMKAKADAKGNKLHFEFVGGTNLDANKDKHMHSAVVTFVDEDHFEIDGCGWEEGKPAKEMCQGMKLIRKK